MAGSFIGATVGPGLLRRAVGPLRAQVPMGWTEPSGRVITTDRVDSVLGVRKHEASVRGYMDKEENAGIGSVPAILCHRTQEPTV